MTGIKHIISIIRFNIVFLYFVLRLCMRMIISFVVQSNTLVRQVRKQSARHECNHKVGWCPSKHQTKDKSGQLIKHKQRLKVFPTLKEEPYIKHPIDHVPCRLNQQEPYLIELKVISCSCYQTIASHLHLKMLSLPVLHGFCAFSNKSTRKMSTYRPHHHKR